MRKNRIELVQILLISLVWILIFTMPFLFSSFEQTTNWNHILRIWRENIILFLIFITNRYWLMPKLFFKQKRSLYFIAITATIIFFSIVLYFLPTFTFIEPNASTSPITPQLNHLPAPRSPQGFIPPFSNLLIMSILLMGFDSGLLFFSKWIKSEQNKLKVEKENVENKMAFLQNQISPHFFMNTLNNIHALVDIDSEEAKNAIIKLSQMMDYMLYESQTGSVSLQREIDFIESYVELMKLRFTDDVDIILDFPKVVPNVMVPPLLTISFIENAFKYGVSYQTPSYIHLLIKEENKRFIFSVKNSIHRINNKKKNSGIGIENARVRLDLIYGDNYTLAINTDTTTSFEVNLNFPL